MESSVKPSVGPLPNPLLSLSSFIRGLGTQLTNRLDDTRRLAAATFPAFLQPTPPILLPFASVSQRQGKPTATASEASLSMEHVARRLIGTSVYTVSNTNNEFVLVSDPDGVKSIGLLCFRKEDAENFLAQVRLRKGELRGGAKVVPITLDQVYMLKVEGIAFRFLPDPVQIKNALEIRASDTMNGFDGVPIFQEDIEKALAAVSRVSRGPDVSQHIMVLQFLVHDPSRFNLLAAAYDTVLSVGSLEDVLKKMEISEKNSGWEDLIFVPPGKSHSQHIQEVENV
ncbi:Tic22-like family protein [Striga asiatica]|uniref:Protein TIC 22, chloroplastic n=1 Tax=Striga asiatica TaxID=4170 RepID=A0A5A7QDG1_STRAF|nr:Tic22-like family protein [Striga asiatica]